MANVGPLTPRRRTLDVPDGLTDDDRAWLQHHAELAGAELAGAELESDRAGRPSADISWITTTTIRG